MRDATWNPWRLLNKQLQMINPMCIVITTIYFLLRGCNIETNLRINFVQLHHNLPQELVAWPVLCMEIHERAAESSNEWVYLHITQRVQFQSKLRNWHMKVRTQTNINSYWWLHTLFGLRRSNAGWFKRFWTFSTLPGTSDMAWRANQLFTTYQKERTYYPTRDNKITSMLCSLKWLPMI
jgi:hypothetical protein